MITKFLTLRYAEIYTYDISNKNKLYSYDTGNKLDHRINILTLILAADDKGDEAIRSAKVARENRGNITRFKACCHLTRALFTRLKRQASGVDGKYACYIMTHAHLRHDVDNMVVMQAQGWGTGLDILPGKHLLPIQDLRQQM
jgi:hypothetical protein